MQQLVDHLGYQPRTCVWEITRACNLSCAHCGSDAGRARAGELGTEECLDVVRQLGALGTKLITLSGGEPTLRPDWPVIGRAATDLGIVVNLVTNGQTDPERLEKGAREARIANVAVSLDGLRATHDAIRAPGAFDRAARVIRHLASCGMWVDVMFTVNRLNLGEMERVHELVGQLGARGFRVQLGKPMGKQTHRRDLTLAPEQLVGLMPLLGELARRSEGPVVRIGDSIGYFSPEERWLRGRHCSQGHWTGCYAGCQAIGIQSDGGIKGCLSLQPRAGEEDPFVEGNVLDGIAATWFRPGAFAYNRSFDLEQLTGACAKCSHKAVCRGGARCVSHTFAGTLHGDPMCWLAVAKDRPSIRQRVWPASGAAATASVLMMLGLPGCGGQSDTTPSGPAADAGMDGSGGSGGGAGGGGTGGTAGVAGSGGQISSDAADTDAISCENVCCECDYGVLPPEVAEACCSQDASVPPDAAPGDAISCEDVCCDCDYGVLPPEVMEACCPTDASTQPDADPCENVCCDCDYGDPPPPGCCE